MRRFARRPVAHASSTLAAFILLAGCSSSAPAPDDPAATSTAPAEEPAEDESAVETAADPAEDQPAEPGGETGVMVQFRGEQLLAGPDTAQGWACAVMGDMVTFQFLDDAGNDVSVSMSDSGTNAVLALADGTTWNQTAGGVANLSEQTDGVYRMSIQLTDIDSGESESMDARLTC